MTEKTEEENPFERKRIDGLLTGPTESPYTNEWYRKQFHRIDHINKVLHTELIDTCHHARSLRQELYDCKQQRMADAAEIGRLNDTIDAMNQRITKLETSMDKARERFAALAKKIEPTTQSAS